MTVTNLQGFASLPSALQGVVAEAADIWTQGGWGMYALALNGAILFAVGTMILLRLLACGAGASADRAWAAWRRDPNRVRGPLGRIVAEAMQGRNDREIAHYFDALRNDEMAPFERDQRVLKIAVTSAPLLGLLGTVTGMLTTFNALARGGGGDKTMGMIASGISEALITTEVGLVMALAGLMFQQILLRKQDKYAKVIAHLETLCLQQTHRGGLPAGGAAFVERMAEGPPPAAAAAEGTA
jgi:biopolymer transport protein ExbB